MFKFLCVLFLGLLFFQTGCGESGPNPAKKNSNNVQPPKVEPKGPGGVPIM